MRIISAYSYDVRNKKPGLFSKLIMFWTGKNYHHCIDSFMVEVDHKTRHDVFDAQMKYECNPYDELMKDYIIVNKCDTIKSFNLNQDQIRDVYYKACTFVGTKYGVMSIIGLVWHGLTKMITIGVDGSKRLICSEASIRLYLPYLNNVEHPIDYLDPKERGRYFPMEKVE